MVEERALLALSVATADFHAAVSAAEGRREALKERIYRLRAGFRQAMAEMSGIEDEIGQKLAVLDTVVGKIERDLQAANVDPDLVGLGFDAHPLWDGPRHLSEARSYERVDGLTSGLGLELEPFDFHSYRVDMDRPYSIERIPDVDAIVSRLKDLVEARSR